MKTLLLAIAYLGLLTGSAVAADHTFLKTKLTDQKGCRKPVQLIFHSRDSLQLKADGQVVTEIPYNTIDGLSYEHTERHRITQGAVVMVASVGAGAVVMLTKSRQHFLTVAYHDAAGPKELVLQLDKAEYLNVLAAARAQTGMDVRVEKP